MFKTRQMKEVLRSLKGTEVPIVAAANVGRPDGHSVPIRYKGVNMRVQLTGRGWQVSSGFFGRHKVFLSQVGHERLTSK